MQECTQEDNREQFVSKFKYNFVFLFARFDYWKTILGEDFYHGDQTRVYPLAFRGNRFFQTLFRLHWSYKVNSRISLPLKRIWFRRIYRQDFERKRPLCFVYIGSNNIRYDSGLIQYIRNKSSENRQVVLNMDLISKKCKYDYDIIRNKVDAAITYDKQEAEKYGILWYPSNFYNRTLPLTEPDEFEFDAYFLGYAKDRLPEIMSVYHRLTAGGLRCNFLLVGVPEEERVPLKGISYIAGIPYVENLENVRKAKCIVEIGQRGSSANTLRLSEAVTYHRKLLTNCAAVKDKDYYMPEIMSVFSSPEEIDLEYLRAPISYEVYSKKNIDFSMEKFLSFIESVIE